MSYCIEWLLTETDKNQYISNQLFQLKSEIDRLDRTWVHSNLVEGYLNDALTSLEKEAYSNDLPVQNNPLHERRIEKYTTWIEVFRLINYQYGRYSSLRCSYSEGLYSALCDLAVRYGNISPDSEIAVLGCGPGRTVADLAIHYPDNIVWGLDYSYLALKMAEKFLVSKDGLYDIPIRDTGAAGDISSTYSIASFGLDNVKLGLFDIVKPHNKKYDLIVCSNTINLMPDHEHAMDTITSMLNEGGVVVYADLAGWRLDRSAPQRVLNSMNSIIESFEKRGFRTLEYFKGGPYIEFELENRTEYMEYFYVGIK